MAKTKYDIIHQDLEILNGKMDENNKLTENLAVTVKGDGGKGHEQRLSSLETWKDTRPQKCPHEIREGKIMARRGVEVGIMALVLSALFFFLERCVF